MAHIGRPYTFMDGRDMWLHNPFNKPLPGIWKFQGATFLGTDSTYWNDYHEPAIGVADYSGDGIVRWDWGPIPGSSGMTKFHLEWRLQRNAGDADRVFARVERNGVYGSYVMGFMSTVPGGSVNFGSADVRVGFGSTLFLFQGEGLVNVPYLP